MKFKYTVWLTLEEEARIAEISKHNNLNAHKFKRAMTLRHCHEETKTDQEIADALFMPPPFHRGTSKTFCH
jgi:hypothetical protein